MYTIILIPRVIRMKLRVSDESLFSKEFESTRGHRQEVDNVHFKNVQ